MNVMTYNETPPHHDDDGDFITIRDLFNIIKRGRYIIAGCTALAGVLAMLYLAFTPPSYTSTARILIDPREGDLVNGGGSAQRGVSDLLLIDSQIEILQSGELLRRAAEKIGLFEIGTPDKPSIFAVMRTKINEFFQGAKEEIVDEETRRTIIINRLKNKISLDRIKLTYAIGVSMTSQNPEFSAKVANAVTDAYLEDQIEAKYTAARKAREWTQRQLFTLREELNAAENEVEDYKETNDLVQVTNGGGNGGGALISDQQLAQLSTQLLTARSQTADAEARLQRITKIVAEKDASAAVSDVLRNPLINTLREDFSRASRRAQEMKSRFGEQHEVYKKANEEIGRIENVILSELVRIEQSYRSDYEIALAREETVDAQLTDLKKKSVFSGQKLIKLRELERQVQAARDQYQSLLDNSKSLAQRETLPISDARIIDRATISNTASFPSNKIVTALALGLGLIMGVAVVFIREAFDNSVWNQDTLEKLTGRNSVGAMPQLSIPRNTWGGSERKNKGLFGGLLSRKDSEENTKEINSSILQPYLKIASQEFSQPIEVLRAANLTLRKHQSSIQKTSDAEKKRAQVVSFLSTQQGEGKTAIGLLYGLYMANNRAKVLMIDADYRRPSLTRVLAPKATQGIFDVTNLTNNVHSSRTLGSDLLPSEDGERPVTVNDIRFSAVEGNFHFLPGRIRQNNKLFIERFLEVDLKILIDRFKDSYDVILLDLPPLLALPDARAVGDRLDGVIYVTEWGKTEKVAVTAALQHAPEVAERIVGVLLNKVNMNQLRERNTSEYMGGGYYS